MSVMPVTRRPVRRMVAASLLTGAAVAMPAAAAEAVPPDLSVGEGTLLARGAAVRVPLIITCPAGLPGSAYVSQFVQRRGNATVNGLPQSAPQFTCTGAPQTADVIVTPASNGVFGTGPAVITAFAQSCTPDFVLCESTQFTDVMRVRRR